MEPRLSFGTIICVSIAIALGVYCLYASALLSRRADEVHLGPTQSVYRSISSARLGPVTKREQPTLLNGNYVHR
jgi:hypothetical protein